MFTTTLSRTKSDTIALMDAKIVGAACLDFRVDCGTSCIVGSQLVMFSLAVGTGLPATAHHDCRAPATHDARLLSTKTVLVLLSYDSRSCDHASASLPSRGRCPGRKAFVWVVMMLSYQ
jgi:hypothetical protein